MEIHFVVLCYLSFLLVNDVYGSDADERVSVMEGDNVTLYTDVDKQREDLIVWSYGPENTVIAKINGKANSSMSSEDERFRDRLKLDDQTGDLIITNITPEHTGDYKLKISRNNKASYKKINVNVYAHLPVPVISSNSSQCSSSSSSSVCVLLCSVLNVRDVSLSWYKGNSLLSIISVSDLNIRLSLPLEVDDQDTNTYRCVLNNTSSKQTQHLNNIKNLCHMCSDTTDSPVLRVIIISAVCVLLLCVICVIICVCIQKNASHMKHVKVNLIDKEKSNSNSMVEDPEASRFLNGA